LKILEESNITRFVSGLRREIQDVVELYDYSSLEKLVHLTIEVESELLNQTHFKTTHNDDFYQSSWKEKNKTSSKEIPSNFVKDTIYNPRVSQPSTFTPKSPTKTSSKKCFKCLSFGHIATNCPSKMNTMVKRGVVMSDHSSQRSRSPTFPRSQSKEECGLPCQGNLLVIRCMLRHIQKPFEASQREKKFHTRCLINNNKLCSLIVDGGGGGGGCKILEKKGGGGKVLFHPLY